MTRTSDRIEDVFSRHFDELDRVVDLSRRIKDHIREVDGFIEENTSEVCSNCERKCCIEKYSHYGCDDLIYIYALGMRPSRCAVAEASEPCHLLSRRGCTLDRTVRPSGCNWHFCDTLVRKMSDAPGTAYADFNDSMEEMMELWMEMMGEFRMKFRELTGEELDSAELVCASDIKAYRSDL